MQVKYLTQEQCSGEPESLYASMGCTVLVYGMGITYVLSTREMLMFPALVIGVVRGNGAVEVDEVEGVDDEV